MEEGDHATRMGTLRRELEQERDQKRALEVKVAELQQLVEELQASEAMEVGETDGEDGTHPIEGVHQTEADAKALMDMVPSEREGLPHLISLYGTALQDSKNISKVSLERPDKFTGLELEENPYALTYWYRDVLCWCQAYAFNRPMEQLVLAINQALAGTAKAMVQNLIMRDPASLASVEDLYRYLRKTFQSQDPGPEAWREFHTARMKRTENVLQYLNRLVQLSFVVNASTSPVCRTLTEHDISARLQHGLPSYLQGALYKHLDHLVEVDKAPDMEPGNLAAIIFKLEREENDRSRKDTRQPSSTWKSQPTIGRNRELQRSFVPRTTPAVAAALPSTKYGNGSNGGGMAKRQRKRFDDLDEDQKNSIVKVQTKLASKPLGAKLSPEEKDLCLAHALCLRCRRYGHDQAACKMASVMGAPKN